MRSMAGVGRGGVRISTRAGKRRKFGGIDRNSGAVMTASAVQLQSRRAQVIFARARRTSLRRTCSDRDRSTPRATGSTVLELQLREPRVEPAGGRELLVGAFLDDAAGVHHQDAVAGEHGRQPMRDHQRGALLPSAARARPVPASRSRRRARRSPRRAAGAVRCAGSARAMAMRWRWPPDSVTPRSPTGVSNPCGRRPMNSGACASSAARSTSASLASGRPKRMLSAIDAAKIDGILRHQRDALAQARADRRR